MPATPLGVRVTPDDSRGRFFRIATEIAKVCGSIGLSVAAHNSLCTNHIYKFASDDLKKKYLPKLASGEWIGAWGLTEANTGSDAGNMRCVAVRDGDDWVINGTRMMCGWMSATQIMKLRCL